MVNLKSFQAKDSTHKVYNGYFIHFPGILKIVFNHDESTAPSDKALFLHQGHCMACRHAVRAATASGCALT